MARPKLKPAATPAAPKASPTVTTAQRLDSLLKSTRKIMRPDTGLNGDLDRLPMLTWIMFLKFLDDLERVHEEEAALAGKPFTPAIEAPYRWRDWAAPVGSGYFLTDSSFQTHGNRDFLGNLSVRK